MENVAQTWKLVAEYDKEDIWCRYSMQEKMEYLANKY